MVNFPLPRLDSDSKLKELLLPYCRFKPGYIWIDEKKRHKIACIDAADENQIKNLMGDKKSILAVHDPPYNFVAFEEKQVKDFIEWSKNWIENTYNSLDENSALYIWLGADQNNHFQPLPDFMLMMQNSKFDSRSFITMRNQRGYGTQKNWMSIRQELLYYIKGKPKFNIDAEYTEIPKILKGYYKVINGKETENMERSKSNNIRAGNVWVDIQQVFYRMEENINGCYAQKPMKSIERIINAGSDNNDIVLDFFSHSGTTLLACEKNNRICYTSDLDPIFCEITLRRLENYRNTGKVGFQNSNPFLYDILENKTITNYLSKNYGYNFENIDEDLFGNKTVEKSKRN